MRLMRVAFAHAKMLTKKTRLIHQIAPSQCCGETAIGKGHKKESLCGGVLEIAGKETRKFSWALVFFAS